MPATKYNARDVVFQIENYASPGTWVAISTLAINTFTKSEDEETTDTTTFGSAGQAESMKMQIGKSLQLEGFRLRDSATGALDPGQAIVEAMNDRLGPNSLTGFRYAHTTDTTWTVWAQTRVSLGDQGGGNNDEVSWSATFTRSGPSTTAAKP
ncbi:phage tail tube protein [Streptomyces sp. NPDC048507]|uniref:phage tail tube protein n=1 Tax=Streptomyces sp. NPDC048507 TaxID=3365560 RepID=UPI00371BA252